MYGVTLPLLRSRVTLKRQSTSTGIQGRLDETRATKPNRKEGSIKL